MYSFIKQVEASVPGAVGTLIIWVSFALEFGSQCKYLGHGQWEAPERKAGVWFTTRELRGCILSPGHRQCVCMCNPLGDPSAAVPSPWNVLAVALLVLWSQVISQLFREMSSVSI